MNVLIIEDENKTAQLLKELIENHADYLVVNITQSISSSVDYLEKHQSKLDLIFMDIQLADGESFEIFNLIKITKPVVFCTAFNDYFLKAFKNNGIDYILKPFRQKDLDAALQKIAVMKTAFSSNMTAKLQNIQQTKIYQTSFIVQQKEKMVPIAVDLIALIFIELDVVYAITFGNEKVAIFKTLDDIEKNINPKNFFRINRQMLVNRNAVRDIEPYFNRKVVANLIVNNRNKAIVSRLKVTPFKNWLEKPE
ncbi:MAG: LytTR family DNA-binding domain-containing protein [Flavobacteriaceae bacterium]|nr:LytTR family DNA-binding domain-containing protein [Flavobacteriaceae bacterium]